MRVATGILAFLALSTSASAQGWVIPRPCCPPPRPCGVDRCPAPPPCRTECPAGGAMVERQRSEVRADLADRVIRYEITETFVNRGGRLGEADYLFPLPRNAAFQDLRLEINGELVSGETMNAAEARRIYEEIVRRERDPALVEWMGHGLLRARIFPIAPGEEKKVVVRYHTVPEREGDVLRVDYFRGAGRARPVEQRDSERRARDGRASFVLTFPQGAGYGRPYSPTHELRVSDEGRRQRVEVRGDARDVTILLPVRRSDAPAVGVLAHAPGGEDGFALVTLSPPARAAAGARATPRDVTLVLDVSGSMSGRKMTQAKAAGRQFLASLDPGDRFRIIDFSTDVRSFRDDFVPATRANLAAAERYLDDLEAHGSTNIEGALREALRGDAAEGRLPVVLFMTDGEPTVGERSAEGLSKVAADRRGRARIFTFGVGADVSVPLVEQLALGGRGTAHFVRPEESVEHAVAVVASRITSPVVTDLTVRTGCPQDIDASSAGRCDVRLSKTLPNGPVDIFAGQDLVLLTRYRGSGTVRLRFEGRTASGPVSWSATAEFPERERANPFVARLWATQRVGWLSAERRRNGASRELDDEIRDLGERFGIPTEFTSYFVREPGMVVDAAANTRPMVRPERRQAGQGAVAGAAVPQAAPAATSARDEAFTSAKAAARQREALSVAALDSMSAAAEGAGSSAATRRVASRTFVLQGGVWTDTRHRADARVIAVKAYSAAYFELLELLPELKDALALGERVTVAGRGISLAVGDAGLEQLGERERSVVRSGWQ